MEPWRRNWLARHVNGEALEWKALGVVVLFIATLMAVQDGKWWAVPVGVFGAWLCVAIGDSYRKFMTEQIREQDDDR